MTTIVWFRQDLRLADNAALREALGRGLPIVPVYIFAPAEEGRWAPGGAARWWLHHSLARLDEDLRRVGSRLCLRLEPDSQVALMRLAQECGATRVFWNRRYEPALIERDRRIKAALRAAGLEVESRNSALLREPWEAKTQSGGPYQVFTPYWRHCLAQPEPAEPWAAPASLPAPRHWPASRDLDELALLPRRDWASGFGTAWTPGSAGAARVLDEFLNGHWQDYARLRDRPDVRGTSRLSPHLHFGEIGPREIWHAARRVTLARGEEAGWRESKFLAELGWREFAHHLLYHFPQTPEQPLRAEFARFPWKSDAAALRAWQRGATGYPIVDAGMRELWRTGWMHNRVRMIAASFLVKDLMLPWTDGARWFWDTLVDADLASNTLGWQWVAGCGADAAPYFRIFNPVTQATKFDPDGTYIRQWVPELKRLEPAWIHQPWMATPEVLAAAGVELGVNYPQRLIAHDTARVEALAALATLKR
jgi:deoxyribodipyrimidine photo-lyase